MGISYHNGDHYNSVRRLGACAASPSRISLCLVVTDCDNYRQLSSPPDLSQDSGQDSDYENSPSSTKLDRLATEVANLAGVDVKREVFDALELNAYCVTSAVDYLINDAVSLAKSSLWQPGGTGARIFGEQTASKAASSRASDQKKAQERLANMQQKLQNKNLSNKKRKELKKHQRKLQNTEKKRNSNVNVSDNTHTDESELVRANVQALTI